MFGGALREWDKEIRNVWGYSEGMGQGDQGVNLSNKKGRFESPDKNGFTICESGFGPEIGCCRVVEI